MMNKIKDKQLIVFLFVFVLCGVFLFWKAPYGYIFNDEPFMVTLGHRIIKGDKLFVNEWNLAQTTGLVFAPFIWGFTSITGSTEGVILFCRYVYVVWWLFTGFILFRRLRQYGWISIVAMLYFLLFTPLDEMSLTYNSVALSCLVLFLTYFLVNGKRFYDYLCGLALTVAVLVYPLLSILYVIYALAVLIFNCSPLKKRFSKLMEYRFFDKMLFFRVSLVAIICAALFFVFIFSAGVNSVLSSLKNIISSSGSSSIVDKAISFVKQIIDTFSIQIIAGTIVLFLSLIDKNRYKRTMLYFILQVCFFCASIVINTKDIYSFNTIMFPIVYLGAQSFVLLKNKDWRLLIICGIPGIIYSLCAFASSDTGMMAFSTGISVSGIASLIFIKMFFCENMLQTDSLVHKRAIALIAIVVFGLQIGSESCIKLVRSYWDNLFPALNNTIDVGAAKGIITTEARANLYLNVFNDIEKIKDQTKADSLFLSLSLFPSVYLDMDYEYGTYSSWTYYKNQKDFDMVNQKLTSYYNMNKKKIADVIYISDSDYEGIAMMDFVDLNKYKCIELSTGVVYIK